MANSFLVAINDSASSRSMMDFFEHLPLDRKQVHLTLLHVYRKSSASEELMGEEYMKEKLPAKMKAMLQNTRDELIGLGFAADSIEVKLITDPYPTITDGIIDQFTKGSYDLVVIGRKEMSKAEEFVLGDISTKLVRSLPGAAILIVKRK